MHRNGLLLRVNLSSRIEIEPILKPMGCYNDTNIIIGQSSTYGRSLYERTFLDLRVARGSFTKGQLLV